MNEKEKFLHNVTIICDTREQRNLHIISALERFKVRHTTRKLDFGDYSFEIFGKSFEMSCCIERKANIDELWKNITADRQRFEKEIGAIHRIMGQPVILLENCGDRSLLQKYVVSDSDMTRQNRKVKDIGKIIDDTLSSWAAANRYDLRIFYTQDPNKSAAVMLEVFYWHWHNFSEMSKPIRKN